MSVDDPIQFEILQFLRDDRIDISSKINKITKDTGSKEEVLLSQILKILQNILRQKNKDYSFTHHLKFTLKQDICSPETVSNIIGIVNDNSHNNEIRDKTLSDIVIDEYINENDDIDQLNFSIHHEENEEQIEKFSVSRQQVQPHLSKPLTASYFDIQQTDINSNKPYKKHELNSQVLVKINHDLIKKSGDTFQLYSSYKSKQDRNLFLSQIQRELISHYQKLNKELNYDKSNSSSICFLYDKYVLKL